MQREEFEGLTGIRPTQSMYRVIENCYIASNLDKEEFCRQYSLNVDGIAEIIQRKADQAEEKEKQDLRSRITKLQKQLDNELEWDYCAEFGTCMSQKDYVKMLEESRALTDEETVHLLSELFGFKPELVKIHHVAEEFESNKYGDTRAKSTYCRRPVYKDQGCNYIRFDCAGKRWELINGDLLPYDSRMEE